VGKETRREDMGQIHLAQESEQWLTCEYANKGKV
jgi:hypothetical protein